MKRILSDQRRALRGTNLAGAAKRALCLLVLLSFCGMSAGAVSVSAASAALYDPLTGSLLYEKAADERRPMASTTKIMTALVTVENCDLAEVVTVPRQAAAIEGTRMYLETGEKVTVKELLQGLLLSSGNDAAMALACHVAGDVPGFAALMNDKAAELGLRDSHFENPSGLDGETHYTTARELAVIAAHLLENPILSELVSLQTVKTDNGRYLTNHNKMLRLYDGATGVKTGFTKKSGRCLVSSAARNGRELIAVTLAAPDDWNDHTALLDYGFSLFQETALMGKGADGPEIALADGRRVGTYAAGEISFFLQEGEREQLHWQLEGPQMVYAPVVAGETFGQLVCYLGEKEIGRTELRYGERVDALPPLERGWFANLWRSIVKWFRF